MKEFDLNKVRNKYRSLSALIMIIGFVLLIICINLFHE